MDAYREGLWADFQKKWPVIAGFDFIEPRGLIRDHSREDVESAGRALRVAATTYVPGKGQRLLQRNQIHSVPLQCGASVQRNAVYHEVRVNEVVLIQAAQNGLRGRQKASPQLVSLGPEAEIQARRLKLRILDRRSCFYPFRTDTKT